jgi:hypothetical protein
VAELGSAAEFCQNSGPTLSRCSPRRSRAEKKVYGDKLTTESSKYILENGGDCLIDTMYVGLYGPRNIVRYYLSLKQR